MDYKANDYFIITKTVGGTLTIYIKNDETQATLNVTLTEAQPSKRLPAAWAVNVFSTEDAYRAYKMGYFTFDRNEELIKLAYETGHYFDPQFDFTPAKPDHLAMIKKLLMEGKVENIKPLFGSDKSKRDVVLVARENLKDLKVQVVRLIEDTLKIQLNADGE